MSSKLAIDRLLADSFAARPCPGLDVIGVPPANGASRGAPPGSRHSTSPRRSLIARAVRLVLAVLLYPLRVVDYLVHSVVYAVTSPIRSFDWRSRSDELRYVVLGPIVAILSGPLFDPLARAFFDWTPGRRLYAFILVSLGGWTICFVRLFDARTYAYRDTEVRRHAALWAHAFLWVAGLLFHPLFADVTRANHFLPFADARWLIFVAFGAAAVVWHFADWWPTYQPAEIVHPIPRRPNPYVPPRVFLSPHRDWLPNAYEAADGFFERGSRLTPIAELSARADAHWDQHDITARKKQ